MAEILGKPFRWNQEKNQQLQTERKISFEMVISSIEKGQLIDTIQHPNQEKYPNQRIFIVEIDRYIYLVPFVEDDAEFFLKTVIPSRKMTKQYLGE
jgi:nitrogen regulatory protein PII